MRTGNASKGDLTRQRIIELSARVFNQKGFAGAALSDLMEATGLEKGGIYRHFESKLQLAEEAFDYTWNLAQEKRFAGSAEIPDAVDRLIHVIRNFQDRTGLVPGGCPLLNTAIESDDGNPRLRAKARRALARLVHRMQTVIDEGKQSGQVRTGVDSGGLAMLIVGTLEGGIMMSRLERAPAPLAQACDHLEDYLERNVRAAAAPAAAPGGRG
jgi:TetR/AcrR family transcriptional repressor of nem operon